MANWASTDYVIEGSKEGIQRIYDAIKNHPVQEDSAENWEGNVLHALNLNFEKMKINDSTPYMRGFIQEDTVELIDNILTFGAEEAWGATDFADVLNIRLRDIKVFFCVVEPGCEVYATNDREGKYFRNKWYADVCINGEYDTDYFTTTESMLEWLEKKTYGKIKTIDDIDKFNEEYEEEGKEDENFICIHEFSIVD